MFSGNFGSHIMSYNKTISIKVRFYTVTSRKKGGFIAWIPVPFVPLSIWEVNRTYIVVAPLGPACARYISQSKKWRKPIKDILNLI